MPSESLPVVVMVWVALSFIFFEAHTAGNAWPVCGRGGGGIRVFGRALAYEGGLWKRWKAKLQNKDHSYKRLAKDSQSPELTTKIGTASAPAIASACSRAIFCCSANSQAVRLGRCRDLSFKRR